MIPCQWITKGSHAIGERDGKFKTSPDYKFPFKTRMESIKMRLPLLSSADYTASIIRSTWTSKRHPSLKRGRWTDGWAEREGTKKIIQMTRSGGVE